MIARAMSLVTVLCISTLLFAGANAQRKAGKPDKPGHSTSERIIFWGDLEGDEIVEGCCPNAGPFPLYTMTLSSKFDVGGRVIAGEHEGHLFTNRCGVRKNRSYLVQFWFSNDDGKEVFIEIRGGIMNESGEVIFTEYNCNCKCWLGEVEEPLDVPGVAFILMRWPL